MTKPLEPRHHPVALAPQHERSFDEHAEAIAKRQYMLPSDGSIAGMFRRVANWVASAEASPSRGEWSERYFALMMEKRFCPGGRVLAGAGTQHGNVLNCFQGETLVETRDGQRRIRDLAGNITVLSQDGVYRQAEFQGFGMQELWQVVFENGETIEASAGHEWTVGKRQRNGRYRRATTENLAGHFVPIIPTKQRPAQDEEFDAGVRHGITYGDGSKNTNGHTHHVQLFGEKRDLSHYFDHFRVHDAVYAGRSVTVAQGMRGELKQLPDELASDSYWYGFFCGLLATDGGIDDRGSAAIYQSDIEELSRIARQLVRFGIKYASIRLFRHADAGYEHGKPAYALRLVKQTLVPADFVRPDQRQRFEQSLQNQKTPRNASLQVLKVEPTGRFEEVFCCVEPETHSFVVQGGLLTGNCFVQGATDNPADSFAGVMEVAKKLALVTKVGGGNGVNLDVYPPRSARSSEGVRGWAYMAANHPDSEDFVRGLMRPPTQPDGAKQPTVIRNWSKVIYGVVSPAMASLARQNGVMVMAQRPDDLVVVPDDMGGIIESARQIAESAKNGRAPRIDLSDLRAEGMPILGSGGTSSGPVSFLFEIFDNFLEWANLGAEQAGPVATLRYCYASVLRVVRQGGSRRGAGMATIAIDHPDILDFLTAKDLDRESGEGDISTFNISILATERFWQTLQADGLWDIQPLEVPGKYYVVPLDDDYNGVIPSLPVREIDGAKAVPLYRDGVPAQWLWRQIAEHAWSTGEPGLIFIDRVNEFSAIRELGGKYIIKSTNPLTNQAA
jgi:ribonucleoside-diphosphate reductase alpha chain